MANRLGTGQVPLHRRRSVVIFCSHRPMCRPRVVPYPPRQGGRKQHGASNFAGHYCNRVGLTPIHITRSGCPASIVSVPGRRGAKTFCRPARGPMTLVRCLVHACAGRNSIILSGYVNSNAATVTTVHAKQRCVKFRVRPACYRVTKQQVQRRLRHNRKVGRDRVERVGGWGVSARAV